MSQSCKIWFAMKSMGSFCPFNSRLHTCARLCWPPPTGPSMREPMKRPTPNVSVTTATDDVSYPFMSTLLEGKKFTIQQSFGVEERWKYEFPIIIVCIVMMLLYWGVFRKETMYDKMIADVLDDKDGSLTKSAKENILKEKSSTRLTNAAKDT